MVNHIREQRLVPVTIREKAARRESRSNAFRRGITTRDIVGATRQLATMINAGLPLVQSLDVLAKQSENNALADVLKAVLYDIEAGSNLADALRKHPRVFTSLYVNMVTAGEAGGILDTILLRLATLLEKSDALVRKVARAMIYPAVVLTVAVAAVAIMLAFVIPTFQTMFDTVGAALPAPTRLVISLSQLLQHYWWALAAGGAVTLVGLRRYYATPAGRLAIDRASLRIPVLGIMLRKAAVARFTRTLGTLLSSGVSLLDALEITARTAGNRVIHDAVMASRANIAAGETITTPLKRSGVFPPMVVQMINVGEQTGGLDEMLTKIADFYDDEVDDAVEGLLKAVEPIMIVVLGAIIGGMIVAMYLPVFSIVETVR